MGKMSIASVGGVREGEQFDRDYYEDGVSKRISGYDNYHWMPERSFSEAISIIDHVAQFMPRFKVHNGTVIDIGCAKGFIVKAFRALGLEAYGEDISEYALTNCDPAVKGLLSKPTTERAQVVLCKDVLEHVPAKDMQNMLTHIKNKMYNSFGMNDPNIRSVGFFAIPLGDNDKFRIREYEIDITHVTKKDECWWISEINKAGLKLIDFRYSLSDLKAHWVKEFPHGNGFFTVIRTDE